MFISVIVLAKTPGFGENPQTFGENPRLGIFITVKRSYFWIINCTLGTYSTKLYLMSRNNVY